MDFDSEDREDGKLIEAEECGKEEGNELLKDIFGVSDGEEGEDFEGFTEEDCKASQRKRDKRGDHEGEREDVGENGEGGESHHGSDHDGEILDDGEQGDKVWDFDVMMEKRRAEMKKRRKRRKDVDFINDSDDMIEDMMKTMREAAEKDRELNKQKKPAIAMMQNLKYVKYQLKKVDLHQAFLDSGILTSIAEWLAPLPNHALPHHEIREALLKQLTEFPAISTEGLKMSGLGKAVMFLLKHPKELPQNKQICRKLINDWARPFFNQNADYKALSKEEREQRDYERLTKRRKLSESEGSSKNSNNPDKVLRPGDPGYVYRARVPAPSIKDYVIRPKWNVEDKPREGPQKKKPNKLAKLQRAFMDQKKAVSSAVKISIEGRNMKL